MIRSSAIGLVLLVVTCFATPAFPAPEQPEGERPDGCTYREQERALRNTLVWALAVSLGDPVYGAGVLLAHSNYFLFHCGGPFFDEALKRMPGEFGDMLGGLPRAADDALDSAARATGDMAENLGEAADDVAHDVDQIGRDTVGRATKALGNQRDRTVKDAEKGWKKVFGGGHSSKKTRKSTPRDSMPEKRYAQRLGT